MEKLLEPLELRDPNDIKNWFERFDLLSSTNPKISSNSVPYMLTFLGKDAYKLLKDLVYPRVPKDLTVVEIEKALCDHLIPCNYEVHERSIFNSLVRKPNQPVKDFIVELQQQAMKCNFDSQLEIHLRDRLVAGINNAEIKKKFLRESSLTLQTAKEIAIAHSNIDSTVNENSPVLYTHKKVHHRHQSKKSSFQKGSDRSTSLPKGKCFSCGGPHMRQECRFRNAKCHSCEKQGHISRVCRNSNKVHLIENDSEVEDNFVLHSNPSAKHISKSFMVSDCKSSKSIHFILDTGSPFSFIKIEDLYCFTAPIRPTTKIVKGITGHELKLYGEIQLKVQSELQVTFLICDSLNILGCDDTLKLHPEASDSLLHGFVEDTTVQELIEKASNSRGGMKVRSVHIDCEKDNTKFLKNRPIPYGLREPVQKTLGKLEADGIIKKVSSSKWATPIVTPIKPNGQPRICGDYKVTVNPILKQKAAITREPEDLFMQLNQSKYFSKIDLENAFLQIPLDEESQEITTINTPYGLYSWKFLPFGLNVSPSIFQEVINDVIKDLQHTLAYQDDIIVHTPDLETHNQALKNLMERLIQFNIKINKNKSIFRCEKIKYLGYLVSQNGIEPDPEKFGPIMQAKDPNSKVALQSTLGSLQYYSRFVPNFADIAAPLFELCRKNTDFHFGKEHKKALSQLKESIFSKCLKPFSFEADTKLICDASEFAIGGVIEQNGLPVICVSRRLSDAEKGYAQTQKEALAVFWCTRRLHKFLFGKRFTVVTDHQSLVRIFNPTSSLSKTTSQMLQRWAIHLSNYDYTIEHRSGKLIPQADYLSRHSFQEAPENNESALFTQPLPVDRSELANETRRFYGPVIRAMKFGWSAKSRKQFHDLYVRRDELSISIDGLLCAKDLIVIPPTSRKQILEQLHSGHLGSEKMKSLSRLLCWWPSINNDISNFHRNCMSCKSNRKSNSRSDWKSWPLTYERLQRVHADYAGPIFGKFYLLVIVDSFSRWPEVFVGTHADAKFTERCLRSFFAREGLPQTLVTDNGTHFTEVQLNKWLERNNVIHLFTAPRHPKSNGSAENFVKTIKRAIESAHEELHSFEDMEKFIHNFLFQYRNAIHCSTGERPSTLFRGHVLRNPIIGNAHVIFRRGNDLKPARGFVVQQIGAKMVLIYDLEDGSMHRRHREQIEFCDAEARTPAIEDRQSQTDASSTPIQAEEKEDETSPEHNCEESGRTQPTPEIVVVDEPRVSSGVPEIPNGPIGAKRNTAAETPSVDETPCDRGFPSDGVIRTRSGRRIQRPQRLDL